MLKKIIFISFLAVVVVGLLLFGSTTTKASADSTDNLVKASVNVTTGWAETVIYPVQQAAKGVWGKILFPANIVIGTVKGAVREVAGATDFLTFFKEKNIIDSITGEEL